jgi:SAM-dependent methyltransferase
MPESGGSVADLVTRTFWMLLWRAPSDADAQDCERAIDAGQRAGELVDRLIASTEFRLLATAVREREDTGRHGRAVAQTLAELGPDRAFVVSAYQILLGREPDPSGLDFYTSQLASEQSRLSFLQSLLRSDEFDERYRRLCPQAGFIPRDVQLCELANPAKWDNPEWVALLKSLVTVPPDKLSMHRKAYEFTQLLFGLTRLGLVRDDVQVLSVGAGHEPVLYWLANRVQRVIATDMYGGVWQAEGAREGDTGVFEDPAQFSPFPYHQERLVFLRMDGRFLAFPDASFDVVYSLSSIEHFGGVEGARASVDEMARLLKPGGVLALATEYCIAGPPHHEAFQPDQVHALFANPALELVQPLDDRVWARYDYVPVDLRVNPHQTPHMVVTDLGAVFTSVMMFLRKRA